MIRTRETYPEIYDYRKNLVGEDIENAVVGSDKRMTKGILFYNFILLKNCYCMFSNKMQQGISCFSNESMT